MSETVYETGRLVPVPITSSLEETCRCILIHNNNNLLLDYYTTFEDQLLNELYREYIIRDGLIYKVENYKRHDGSDDIFKLDDNMNFILQYYNGGCGFNEAIDYAFEEKENRNV